MDLEMAEKLAVLFVVCGEMKKTSRKCKIEVNFSLINSPEYSEGFGRRGGLGIEVTLPAG